MKKSTGATPAFRNGFNQKLLGYSATAGAALLVGSTGRGQGQTITLFSTDGGSTFSSSAPTFTGNGGEATNPFTAKTAGSHEIRFNVDFYVRPTNGDLSFDGHSLAKGQFSTAAKLAEHTHVSGRIFQGFNLIVGRNSTGRYANYGQFAPPKRSPNAHVSGYIGFKTNDGDYGWLKIKVMNNGGNGNISSITFTEGSDGVYGQIGDSSVITDGTVSAIPEPATVAGGLGLLALGAAGVREMRRRRKVAA